MNEPSFEEWWKTGIHGWTPVEYGAERKLAQDTWQACSEKYQFKLAALQKENDELRDDRRIIVNSRINECIVLDRKIQIKEKAIALYVSQLIAAKERIIELEAKLKI